ncbi:MAG TPA: DUF1194 domain-containing protein [Pseudolabrys sp.]|jgi:hypothetical protein|nr:DUF1194 domain-containing protein [Pseudolabrys sp.]
MRRLFRCALLLLAIIAAMPARAAEPVDLLLVLAADVSRSVDTEKFQLQRTGYASAIANPRVLEAIRSGINGRIAICFVEWSGFASQKLVIDWMMIDGPKAAQKFGDMLLETPRSFADRTSISGGIDFAVTQFGSAPFSAPRRTIDVSGDGTNNAGRDVMAARDEAVSLGITINGLVILSENPLPWNPAHTNPPGGLDKYYRDNVVGGPGAFVMVAKDFNSFGQALINKLVAEIAQREPGKGPKFARSRD